MAVALLAGVLVTLSLVLVFTRGGARPGASRSGPRATTGTYTCGSAGGSASASSPSSSPSPPAQAAGVDVRSFGAVGDGVTDDAPAIRRALAAADSVHIPAGTYLLGSYDTPART